MPIISYDHEDDQRDAPAHGIRMDAFYCNEGTKADRKQVNDCHFPRVPHPCVQHTRKERERERERDQNVDRCNLRECGEEQGPEREKIGSLKRHRNIRPWQVCKIPPREPSRTLQESFGSSSDFIRGGYDYTRERKRPTKVDSNAMAIRRHDIGTRVGWCGDRSRKVRCSSLPCAAGPRLPSFLPS